MADTTGMHPGMGWVRDLPSISDYTVNHETVNTRLKSLGQEPISSMLAKLDALNLPVKLPGTVDLKAWCSPIENQGDLGSCTANAGVGLVEYYERRAFKRHIDASRLFLYKVTRNLMHETGDTGAYLRTTMGALTLFGVPPEEYWRYVVTDFDKEPSAFCYSFAQNYQAISYYRLDPYGTSPGDLLARIKTNLSKGLPSMFGFTVYQSYTQAETNGGRIPFPASGEGIVGGHAVDAVGYNDTLKIKNLNVGGGETTGAFLIRNSWGAGWGEQGYGWLPYEYVLTGLATDWWSIMKTEWVDTGNFG